MPNIISLKTNKDQRGSLTAIEDFNLPFSIKRIFYIYDVSGIRGGHGHIKNKMALISINGSITINVQSKLEDYKFILSDPSKALILDPEDWHTLENFSEKAILLVICSENWSKEDYFYDSYR